MVYFDSKIKKIQNKERILLIVVSLKRDSSEWKPEETLSEMKELVLACHGEVVADMMCRIEKYSASNVIGNGKIKELKAACEENQVDTVIFSLDLKGSHKRNLEDFLGVKVIDRTQLILDIFARRAVSREGKTQVELAQLQYLLPRLTGHGNEMSRLGGGIGTLGPGETKLEVDRRRIDQRITRLKRDLEDMRKTRASKRKQRQERGTPVVSLVGYTNAGKSTLLNCLTQAGQKTQDALFTTLDSLSRKLTLPNNQEIIISDTVGFMHALPHDLVEAFHSTLEEVIESDLLLHVVDISHPKFKNLYNAVLEVLKEIHVSDKPSIIVFNKIDQIHDKQWLSDICQSFPNSIPVSAQNGQNVKELIHVMEQKLSKETVKMKLLVPLNRMDVINELHNLCRITSEKYEENGCKIEATFPIIYVERFKEFKK